MSLKNNKLIIDLEEMHLKNIGLNEVLCIIFASSEPIIDELNNTLRMLISSDFIKNDNGILSLSNKGKALHNDIVCNESKKKSKDADRFKSLAQRLKNLFPKGKKSNTKVNWTDSVPIICKRLETFYRKYGSSLDEYTDDDIVEATERYVKSFENDRRYMKVLKYFIFKDGIGNDGNVECTSDLLNYLENEQDEINDNNWAVKMM